MKKRFYKAGICALTAVICLAGCAEGETSEKIDLNAMTLEEIVSKAKEDGEINSVGMPDTWANWIETWTEIEEEKLLDEFDSGMTTSAIAKEHGRSKGAIESRLADLGRITDTYLNRKPR